MSIGNADIGSSQQVGKGGPWTNQLATESWMHLENSAWKGQKAGVAILSALVLVGTCQLPSWDFSLQFCDFRERRGGHWPKITKMLPLEVICRSSLDLRQRKPQWTHPRLRMIKRKELQRVHRTSCARCILAQSTGSKCYLLS